MSRPVGSASSSNAGVVEFGEVEGERFDAPAQKKTAESPSNGVEMWKGEAPVSGEQAQAPGPLSSSQDLAAQAAREAQERRSAMKALDGLEAPLAGLAAKFPEPISFFGNVELKRKDVAFGAFGDALREPSFTDAAGKLSAGDVRAAVGAQVKKAWPDCTPKEAEQLRQYFMQQISESLTERVAPRLQDAATKMLSDAARSFDATAADPAAVRALATKLTAMADPFSELEAQSSVRDLRAGLGLDPEKAEVSPRDLAQALTERAALLRQEAKKMSHHDRPTLFRALAEQDVGPLFRQAAGVREGSLLSSRIDAVREQGEREKSTIHYVKLASVVAAAGVTGGLSLGAGIGVGVSVSMAAPSVLEAWVSVDAAKAGESAGTMKAGAGEDAHRRAVIETGMAALSVAGSAAAAQGLHGVTEALAEPAVVHLADGIVKGIVHGVTEGIIEEGAHQGGHAIDRALETEGRATGKSALQRAASERP